MGLLDDLVRWPLIQAPMGGGPGRPALAAAVSDAGGMGFLAAGYRTAEDMLGEISETKRLTDQPFGVNVFVPYAPPEDTGALRAYLLEIESEASALGVELGPAEWGDDDWQAKIAVLVQHPVPVVSFAFGCPAQDVVSELHRVGTRVMVTITNPRDADLAVQREVDALCLQGFEAGAHRGGFTDDERDDGYDLLALIGGVREKTDLPLVAAGGVMNGRDLAAVLDAGADAAQVGTAFLRSPESGAHDTYKAALADPQFTTTAVTRAFSGRRARRLGQPVHGRSSVGPERLSADQRGDATSSCRSGQARRSARHEPVGRTGFPTRRSAPCRRDRGSHHVQLPRHHLMEWPAVDGAGQPHSRRLPRPVVLVPSEPDDTTGYGEVNSQQPVARGRLPEPRSGARRATR